MTSNPDNKNSRAGAPATQVASDALTNSQGVNNPVAQHPTQLQEELRQQGQTLALVQAERDEYRRLLYPAIWQQYTEDELRRFAEEDTTTDTQQLEQFVAELEEIVNDNKHA